MDKSKSTLIKALTVLRRSGESLPEFSAELKKLTEEDRAWFRERFLIEKGIEIIN